MVIIFTLLVLQMRKPRNSEVKSLTRSHTASPMAEAQYEPLPLALSQWHNHDTGLVCVYSDPVLWTITCSLSLRLSHSSAEQNRKSSCEEAKLVKKMVVVGLTGKCLAFIYEIILIASLLCNGETQQWHQRNWVEVNVGAKNTRVRQSLKSRGA